MAKDQPWFDRCPKCGAVVLFKPNEDHAVCEKCKAKVKRPPGV